ncbi:MAG TPA: hypothetical protein VLC91_07250, partial [Spongiibacteraceae bacterium]|nr:hypothetical protein [Spongiibacteraceae bacterium]
ASSNNYLTQQPETTLIVLNSDLSERSRATVNGTITAIAPESVQAGQLLVATSETNNSSTYRAQIIDVNSGAWIWRSPLILGGIGKNNLHYDSTAGVSGGRLTIGTSSALYISL